MAHSLEMFFDDESDAAVRRLWSRIDGAGVPSLADQTHGKHHPHVTLAIAESLDAVDREALRTALAIDRFPRLPLHTLGTFPGAEGAVFLAVTLSQRLLERHRLVHEVVAGNAVDEWDYYRPGNWVPHCTLTQRLTHEQVLMAMGAVLAFEPIRATVTAVGITNTVTGSIERVAGTS